ncbi:hypothetical protein H310_08048 [Aphanomyces invadans]|uniref:J domain-containing protein n=1 Tax=Aphanomyces invadans TaxID=157072 RepID=A0A024U0A6_9STRA|nr:hypothetical protein H310_08048 [Aphanomyces invadans]ETV99316.1 hypothetical protein H310_08048 [Aphanomyces invadans]|eukprot:XP_008871872.1 hypothetical protein H310_08048 [Aphanomyces invadans]
MRRRATVAAWSFALAWLGAASPILLSVDINVQGKHVPLAFPQGLEPIDVIERFRTDHALPLDFQQRALQTVCQSIPCTRASPIVFATTIHGDNNEFLGDFQLMQGDEPADAVAAFCRRHSIPRAFQLNMLHSICNQPVVRCSRRDALLFRQPILDETGAMLGTLEIYDNQEPVDAIFAFLQPMRTSSSTVAFEFMLRQLLQVVCQPAIATCTRTIPRLFHHPIVGPDGTDYGVLDILYGQEPVDAIFSFAQEFEESVRGSAVGSSAPLSMTMDATMQRNLLATVCTDPLVAPSCTRDRAIVFSAPIQFDTSDDMQSPPVLTLYAGDEVADVLFHFSRNENLTFPMRRQLFTMLCNRPPITCTRGHAVVYRRSFSIANIADPVGPLQVFEGDEPADRVFELADRFNLSSVVRDQILNTVCVDIKAAINVTCTRFAPVVFQIPITKNASEPPVGMLQILQGEEPVDAIFRFGHEHDLSPEAQASMLPGVCEASQLPCTRTRSLRHVAVRDQLGIPFFADDEPADVVYWYGTSRNWTLMERKQWLAELCQIQRAGEPLLNCTRAEARLFHLPVMETADKEIGTLEVLEDQEPIDQVYAFLEKHDLFQTAPVNESLANITCQHVPCTRLRPRRILFTMQATYLGLKHSIQLVQPEEDWVCAESFGSKKCQHYVQVKSIEYCAKHMPSWAECEDVMGNALRQHLTYYEEDLWKKPNGKDLYAKLGLVKGATSDEIEAAYHALVLRFNNETEPQKYEKLRAAYDTLHDPVKKYYYDLPCLKFFGLCGKRQADGGISISMDN